MKKVKLIFCRAQFYLMAHPKLLALSAAVAFLLVFTVIESIRARVYMSTVNTYKNSVLVMNVRDTSEKISNNSLGGVAANFCSLNETDLLGNNNDAYDDGSDVEVGLLFNDLGQQVERISPPPAFNSLLQFVPNVRNARSTSVDIHGALDQLEELVKDDTRSSYCLGLEEVLSEVYFLSSIGRPEGISVLSVGQLENFQVNTAQAQEKLLMMKPPRIFEAEHVALNKLFNTVAVDLRNDDNEYVEFSRVIEKNVENLEEILESIVSKSSDLQSRPVNISIQINFLR